MANRIDAVVKWRARQERAALEALSHAQHRLGVAQELKAKATHDTSLQSIDVWLLCEDAGAQADRELAAAQKELEAARARHAEAATAAQAICRVAEKQRQAQERAREAAEQRVIDELAARR